MALGIDVGGSKILAITIRNGKISQEWKFPTKDGRVANTIRKIVEESGEREKIGIGVPCYIRDGICVKAPHISELTGMALKKIIPDAIYMNDCTAMAYGEYYLRDEKHDPLLLVALGTGVGAGLVLRGLPYVGRGSAMEIGHIKKFSNLECQCGKRGCLETILGGRYANTRKMYEQAVKGDAQALKFFQEYGKKLAEGLAPAIQLLDPEIVVIGGSVSSAYPYFMPSFLEELEALLSYITPDDIIFERAKSPHSGALGAALIAEQRLL